jgi:hypothetical protein
MKNGGVCRRFVGTTCVHLPLDEVIIFCIVVTFSDRRGPAVAADADASQEERN